MQGEGLNTSPPPACVSGPQMHSLWPPTPALSLPLVPCLEPEGMMQGIHDQRNSDAHGRGNRKGVLWVLTGLSSDRKEGGSELPEGKTGQEGATEGEA